MASGLIVRPSTVVPKIVPERADEVGGVTVGELCQEFLQSKLTAMERGGITRGSVENLSTTIETPNDLAIPNVATFTVHRVSKICKVSWNTVEKWIKGGLLKARRSAGSKGYTIKRQDLVKFIQERFPWLLSVGVVALTHDKELADALESSDQLRAHVVDSAFSLGEEIQQYAPGVVIVDSAIGTADAHDICRRLIERHPDMRIIEIADARGKPFKDAIEVFRRPLDVPMVVERIVHLSRDVAVQQTKIADKQLTYVGVRSQKVPSTVPKGMKRYELPAKQVEPDDVESLAGFFENVYKKHRLIDCSVTATNKHRRFINLMEEFLGREPMLADLTDENVAGVMGHLRNLGRAPGTINDARFGYLAVANHAVRRGLLRQVPEVRPLREHTIVPDSWTEEQVKRLMVTITKLEGNVCGIPAALWWHTLHLVLWNCAVRIGALLQLEWSDYDEALGVMRFRSDTQKDREEQRFPLKPSAIAGLRKIRYPQRVLIFPWGKSIEIIWRDYRQILQAAGLPSGKRDLFHKMRRTAATFYAKAGGNATEMLGHSSPAVTRKYLDPLVTSPAPPAAVLFDIDAMQEGGEQL